MIRRALSRSRWVQEGAGRLAARWEALTMPAAMLEDLEREERRSEGPGPSPSSPPPAGPGGE